MKFLSKVSHSIVLFGVVAFASHGCSDGSGFSGGSATVESRPKPEPKPTVDAKKDEGDQKDVDENDKAKDDKDADKEGEASAAPEEAVVKGSFSAWTEPKNPAARQNYVIIIEVKLPSNSDHFSLQNLSGSVRGTDGFYRQIGANDSMDREPKAVEFHSQFNLTGKMAYLRIPIPGAYKLVKDTISITADSLGESQELVIQFGVK